MAAIDNDWLEPLSGEFKKDYYRKLYQTVRHEYETRQIFPDPDDIFNAFAFTPLSKVKVVILGQDPYHNYDQAHGLCFSVKPDVAIPPSLVNIYQELHDDCGCYIPDNGYLKKWADQGVMLLKTQSLRSGRMQPILTEELAGRNLRMRQSGFSMSSSAPWYLSCGGVRLR